MKKMFLVLAATFLSVSAFSQSFQHGVGVGFFVDKIEEEDIDGRVSFGILYNPRFNFLETRSMSLSIGVPLTVGFSGGYSANYSTQGGSYEENTLGYMFNAPLMLNINLGGGSSKKTNKMFGGFFGGGYGIYSANSTDITRYDENWNEIGVDKVGGSTMGPAVNAGMRFGVGRLNHKKSVEVRFSYFRGTTNYKVNLIGVNAGFNF
jgi:hypothetical protein